jgi:hypothetical protein
MRTIIAGSRTITDYSTVFNAMNFSQLKPTIILSGCAEGADKLGERWAKEHNIPIERYPANWNKYGKKAGYLRNAEMVEKADALVAIWDGVSRGTKHTIDLANKKGIKVFIYEWRKE